jgi:hypothetical protein
MLANRTLRHLVLTAVVALAGGGLALAAYTGGWSVLDGGKKISKRPQGMNFAIITNHGPESVLVTSKGLFSTSSLVVEPDGVTVAFAVPANAKNCVIWDEQVGTGAGAKGFLYWAKKAQTNEETDPPGGSGQ